MREPGRSTAVAMAAGAELDEGVSFADLEARLGRDVPSVRGRRRGEQVLAIARLIVGCAPLLPLLAALGLPGSVGRMRPGIMPWVILGQPLETLALVCFVLSLSSQVWALLTWWHLGRRRAHLDLAFSAFALVVGVLWLVWMSASPPIGGVFPEVLNASVVTTVLLAALTLATQLFASRPGTVEQARAQARGNLLRVLPQEQQQALLVERREVLDVLRDRGVIEREGIERAEILPLGDWWLLDTDESAADVRVRVPDSEANSSVVLRCLKAVALVAPFGMLLLPFGNPGIGPPGSGMRSVMESGGFRNDTLVTMAMLCAVAGIIGQVWTIYDWWRLGRRRDGMWLAWSWTALVASVATLFVFPLFMTGSWGMRALTGPILAVAVTAAVALLLMYLATIPGTVQEVRRLGLAESPGAGSP